MSVAGVVLAAGFSRRLGRPKQDVRLAGETLLQRTVRIASAAQLRPLVVVVQPGMELPGDLQNSDAEVVCNTAAEEGIASSIRAGVSAISHHKDVVGVVLMTCDQVGLDTAHLRALFAVPDRLTASNYAKRGGIPAYFPRQAFSDLLQLHGDTGARVLLSGAHAITAEELVLDIDTEEDVEQARQFLREPSF